MSKPRVRLAGDEVIRELSDEIDIVHLFRKLWSGRLTILIVATVFVLLAAAYLRYATYSYTATLTLMPTQNQSQGIASQFGGLASLAGIDLSRAQGTSPFTFYSDAVRTREVADDLVANSPGILQRMFKAQWNAESQTWVEPKSTQRDVVNYIKSVIGIPIVPWTAPTGADLQQFIIESVRVVQEVRRPVLTLTYNDPDPVFAGQLLQLLHESTDRVLRRITMDRSSKYASYIQKKLATVQAAELRQVLVMSLSEQETLIMMGNSDTPFAAQPLGTPVTSLRPTQPIPTLVLVLGGLLGLIAGGLVVMARSRESSPSPKRIANLSSVASRQ